MGDDAQIGGGNGHQNNENSTREKLSKARPFKPERNSGKPQNCGEYAERSIWSEHSARTKLRTPQCYAS